MNRHAPTMATTMHRASVQAFRARHGRVLSWFYATRRVWIAAVIVAPLVWMFAILVPFMALGLFLVWMMAAVEMMMRDRQASRDTSYRTPGDFP